MARAHLACAVALMASVAIAAPRSEADRIEAALKAVEDSNITFVRNGSEYGPKMAGRFLRGKLKNAGDAVKTFDQFVDALATKSTQSGKPYLVKLESGELVPLAKWLREKDATAAK